MFTWDYHSSISFWSGLRVQPILSDEVQTFKALITVHKVLQEGHPNVRARVLLRARDATDICHRHLRRLTARPDGSRRARVRLAMKQEDAVC